ncbi:MAG: peroxidase family protein, partial [Gemmatimonas sp.]
MRVGLLFVVGVAVCTVSCDWIKDKTPSLLNCGVGLSEGARPIATDRVNRFQGKVEETTARCRGGSYAVAYRKTPWTDWTNYWATRGEDSKSYWTTQSIRGINGSLIDLEYARVELIRFNLFDNSGTLADYINGRNGTDGAALKQWKEMRLPPNNPNYAVVGGAAPAQQCKGALIRFRTLTGICNDTDNPLMGSTGTLFARNVEFESTFPDMGLNDLARNRHGDRLSLLSPDPQVISRRLFTRPQSDSARCNLGYGLPNFAPTANCDYNRAPFMNVLAAFWIQFMTHDWFSHLEEGHNSATYMPVGCATQRVNGVTTPITPAAAAQLGCRPDDKMERAYVADSIAPATFRNSGKTFLTRAPKTFTNTNTAWWDGSQIYGFDDRSRARVKRDPRDRAKLEMLALASATAPGEAQ